MKLKSNLPYYQKLLTKVETDIAELENELAQKKQEHENLKPIVDNMIELEKKRAKEEIKFPLETVSENQDAGEQRNSEKIMEEAEELETEAASTSKSKSRKR